MHQNQVRLSMSCPGTRPSRDISVVIPRECNESGKELTIHAPNTSNDVHRQHNRSENGELAQNVRGLLLPFIHANVDLSEVIAMRTRQ
jgi:hypothetical protein